jgi:hypothetical protein
MRTRYNTIRESDIAIANLIVMTPTREWLKSQLGKQS